jgi:hypothetical protein
LQVFVFGHFPYFLSSLEVGTHVLETSYNRIFRLATLFPIFGKSGGIAAGAQHHLPPAAVPE